MSFNVSSIDSYLVKDWLINKHYAKRMCNIIYSFGLFNESVLEGVITFGMPPSSNLCSSICGDEYKSFGIELNRLVVNEGLPKNTLSYFVSNSIKLLPKPKIIISFSDNNMGHNGYIYQATNFLYTGQTSNTSKLVDKNGDEFHFRNIGHYQKNNKLNAKLIKRRKNDDLINKIDVANYLKSYKGDYTAKMLDSKFGYKDTASHWFRTDNGFSFPSVDDWLVLKELLLFDDKFDKVMTDFEMTPCPNDIIKKLGLTKVDILPKNRYVYFHAPKKLKKKLINELKYDILPYPKGENKRYNCDYKPNSQVTLF